MTKRHAHLSVDHKQAAVERISAAQSAIETATGRSNASKGISKTL